MFTHGSLCSWQSGVICAIIELELWADKNGTVRNRLL